MTMNGMMNLDSLNNSDLNIIGNDVLIDVGGVDL